MFHFWNTGSLKIIHWFTFSCLLLSGLWINHTTPSGLQNFCWKIYWQSYYSSIVHSELSFQHYSPKSVYVFKWRANFSNLPFNVKCKNVHFLPWPSVLHPSFFTLNPKWTHFLSSKVLEQESCISCAHATALCSCPRPWLALTHTAAGRDGAVPLVHCICWKLLPVWNSPR